MALSNQASSEASGECRRDSLKLQGHDTHFQHMTLIHVTGFFMSQFETMWKQATSTQYFTLQNFRPNPLRFPVPLLDVMNALPDGDLQSMFRHVLLTKSHISRLEASEDGIIELSDYMDDQNLTVASQILDHTCRTASGEGELQFPSYDATPSVDAMSSTILSAPPSPTFGQLELQVTGAISAASSFSVALLAYPGARARQRMCSDRDMSPIVPIVKRKYS